MSSKQVIVLRKDLNMRKGKMIAQGAHASMKVILDMMSKTNSVYQDKDFFYKLKLNIANGSALDNWINGSFKKITLSVDSEQELDEIYNEAVEKNIPCCMIVDSGLTEFNGVPTKTAIAIGPDWEENIDTITKKLKLL